MSGPSKHASVAGLNLAWLLADRAERHGDKAFLIWTPPSGAARTWSYRAFWQAVRLTAAGLHGAGLRPGDRILLHADNAPETLIAWFASAYSGAICVTTNTGATTRELRYFVEHAEPKLAIVSSAHRATAAAALGTIPTWVIGEHDPGPDALRFDDLLGSGVAEPADLGSETPLSIQYTSGSTALPKAVLWTHGNAIWGAQVSARHQGLCDDDVYLCLLPFFHTNAQTYSVLPTLWAGGTVVLQARFSASRFWPVALEYGCTRTSLVPFCLRALWEREVPSAHSFRSWGLGVSHPEAARRFGTSIIGWWGMTETVAQGIVTDLAERHPFMSMGRASSAYEVEVRDEDGRLVSPRAEGQLHIRGERGVSIFQEYYRDPAATADAFDADGWFRTGDLVRMDERGELFFVSRLSDVIKCGGENVSAPEVEGVIAQVAGVREAAVVGRPDRMYGEVPVAFVVASGDDPVLRDRILAACRETLAPFKAPREVVVLDDLPRAALNKVAKGRLRQMSAEMAARPSS